MPNHMINPDLLARSEPLLQFIRELETGHVGQQAYDTVYGGWPSIARGARPLSHLTIESVLNVQDLAVRAGSPSSAAGAYQIIRKTLRGLVPEGDPHRERLFTPFVQDCLAVELIGEGVIQGYLNGSIPETAFSRKLCQLWASLPVLHTIDRGSKGMVYRGQSYYDGDGLNSALCTPEEFERVLHEWKASDILGPRPRPRPKKPWWEALLDALASIFRR